MNTKKMSLALVAIILLVNLLCMGAIFASEGEYSLVENPPNVLELITNSMTKKEKDLGVKLRNGVNKSIKGSYSVNETTYNYELELKYSKKALSNNDQFITGSMKLSYKDENNRKLVETYEIVESLYEGSYYIILNLRSEEGTQYSIYLFLTYNEGHYSHESKKISATMNFEGKSYNIELMENEYSEITIENKNDTYVFWINYTSEKMFFGTARRYPKNLKDVEVEVTYYIGEDLKNESYDGHLALYYDGYYLVNGLEEDFDSTQYMDEIIDFQILVRGSNAVTYVNSGEKAKAITVTAASSVIVLNLVSTSLSTAAAGATAGASSAASMTSAGLSSYAGSSVAAEGSAGGIKGFFQDILNGIRDMLTDEARSQASGKVSEILDDINKE